MTTTRRLAEVAEIVETARVRAEFAIGATPTGPARNHLTEANIHLMQAEAAMAKAISSNITGKP